MWLRKVFSASKGGGEQSVNIWASFPCMYVYPWPRNSKSGVSSNRPIKGTRKRMKVTSEPTKAEGGVVRSASDERRGRKI